MSPFDRGCYGNPKIAAIAKIIDLGASSALCAHGQDRKRRPIFKSATILSFDGIETDPKFSTSPPMSRTAQLSGAKLPKNIQTSLQSTDPSQSILIVDLGSVLSTILQSLKKSPNVVP